MSETVGDYLVGMAYFVLGLVFLVCAFMMVDVKLLVFPGIVLMFWGGAIVEGISLQDVKDGLKNDWRRIRRKKK